MDGQTSQLEVIANDLDSGPSLLSYNWIVQPGEGGLDDSTISNPIYTPPNVSSVQTFTLTVEVSDGEDTTTDTIDVTVIDTDSSSLPINDDFDDGDYSGWTIINEGTANTPSAWSAASGTMCQSSSIYSLPNVAVYIEKFGTYAYYSGGLTWTDYQADMTIRSEDQNAIGVMFRYQDSNNYYRFSWDKKRNYRRLVKNEGGVFTLLAEDPVPYIIGQTYQLRIVVQDTLLQVSVDDVPIFSVADSALSSGSIALYTWRNAGGYFDDIVVE